MNLATEAQSAQRKKRVVFQFDERSAITETEFRQIAVDNGWDVAAVETPNGIVLIHVPKSQCLGVSVAK